MQAHEPYRKQMVKLIEEVGRAEGRTTYEVYRDFLEAGYRAFRGRFLFGDAFDKNESEYMKIVQRCRKPQETMGNFSEMLAVTVDALEAECSDFLGPTFMEIGASKDHGQFFTPHALSKLNALMLLPDMDRMIEDSPRGYFTAHEPAAGMGGMVLAVAEVMQEKGFDPARHCHWNMVDVEFKAMAGCYIQTSLAGVSGVVVHGNTLSLEEWQSSITPTAFLYPKRFGNAPRLTIDASFEPVAGPVVANPAPPLPTRKPQLAFDFSV